MTAAPNGASIFPLALITQPQQAEYFVDNLNQLLELIATQVPAASQGQLALPTITDTTDTTKALGFSLSGATTATKTTLTFAQTANRTLTFPDATDTLVGRATADTLTNKTLTAPTINNPVLTGPAPVAVGASLAASGPGVYLLNTAAGSTLTLPAATGSGNRIIVITSTTTTSGSHKILANSSSDFIEGTAVGATAAGATLKFSSTTANTNHSLQMPFSGSQPSGGFIGDRFEFIDIAANLWNCTGSYTAGTTATTPFNSATS